MAIMVGPLGAAMQYKKCVPDVSQHAVNQCLIHLFYLPQHLQTLWESHDHQQTSQAVITDLCVHFVPLLSIQP